MDSVDQNMSKTTFKKISNFLWCSQLLDIKILYIDSVHPFWQA